MNGCFGGSHRSIKDLAQGPVWAASDGEVICAEASLTGRSSQIQEVAVLLGYFLHRRFQDSNRIANTPLIGC